MTSLLKILLLHHFQTLIPQLSNNKLYFSHSFHLNIKTDRICNEAKYRMPMLPQMPMSSHTISYVCWYSEALPNQKKTNFDCKPLKCYWYTRYFFLLYVSSFLRLTSCQVNVSGGRRGSGPGASCWAISCVDNWLLSKTRNFLTNSLNFK